MPTTPISNRVFSNDAWKDLIAQSFQRVEELSRVKGAEYSGDFDRLDNFRRNGRDVDQCMEVVWRIYAGKHWDAISTYIRDVASGKDRVRSEPIDGRIDDLIVYLLLFKAMVSEREQKSFTPTRETITEGTSS